MSNVGYNFITVLTFTYSHEVLLARALLEESDILCNIQDELTAQVVPFYSNAIGGIKLQVQEHDLQKAIKVLVDAGYMKDSNLQPPKLLFNIDKFTARFPFTKKPGFEFRLLLSVLIVIGIIACIVYYTSLTSNYDRLNNKLWCLDQVTYKNKAFIPKTINPWNIYLQGFCEETIHFNEDGSMTMPGFESARVQGRWRLKDDLLEIWQVDTFDFVYSGFYEMDFTKSTVVHTSPKTTLYCYIDEIQLYLPF